MCQRWGGPKAGASLLSCHHPLSYSTCRAPPAPRLHPDWRELTCREAISLQICGKQHKPLAPCGSHQAVKGRTAAGGTKGISPPAPLPPSSPGAGPLLFAPMFLGQYFPLFLSSPGPASQLHAANSTCRKASGQGAPRRGGG